MRKIAEIFVRLYVTSGLTEWRHGQPTGIFPWLSLVKVPFCS